MQIRTKTPVRRLLTSAGRLTGVLLEDNTFLAAESVVLATGGASYPGTGSNR